MLPSILAKHAPPCATSSTSTSARQSASACISTQGLNMEAHEIWWTGSRQARPALGSGNRPLPLTYHLGFLCSLPAGDISSPYPETLSGSSAEILSVLFLNSWASPRAARQDAESLPPPFTSTRAARELTARYLSHICWWVDETWMQFFAVKLLWL